MSDKPDWSAYLVTIHKSLRDLENYMSLGMWAKADMEATQIGNSAFYVGMEAFRKARALRGE